MKTCPKCAQELPLDAFALHAARKDGRQTYCRSCTAKRQKAERPLANERNRRYAQTAQGRANKAAQRKKNQARYSREWKNANPERWQNHRLKTLYKTTLDEVRALAEAQDYKCAICKEPKKLVVDHCHTNGHVRGLLCQQCNGGIGFLKDSPTVLESAADYLRSDRARRLSAANEASHDTAGALVTSHTAQHLAVVLQ